MLALGRQRAKSADEVVVTFEVAQQVAALLKGHPSFTSVELFGLVSEDRADTTLSLILCVGRGALFTRFVHALRKKMEKADFAENQVSYRQECVTEVIPDFERFLCDALRHIRPEQLDLLLLPHDWRSREQLAVCGELLNIEDPGFMGDLALTARPL